MATFAASSITTVTSSTYISVVLSSFPVAPLKTTFTPPGTSCAGIYWSILATVDAETSCLPSGFNPAATSFFSPGIICPSGYHSACTDNQGVESITTVTCCPNRQKGEVKLSCVDPSTLESLWENEFCTWVAPADGQTVKITKSFNGGRVSTVTITMTSPEGVKAFGIRMVYQASDLPSSSPGGAGGNKAGSGGDITSQTTSGSNGGLSTGAIVGISVVIPIVVIAVLIAGFGWKKRKSQYGEVHSAASPGTEMDTHQPAYQNQPAYEGDSAYEVGDVYSANQKPLSRNPPMELSEEAVPSELAGHSKRTELPA